MSEVINDFNLKETLVETSREGLTLRGYSYCLDTTRKNKAVIISHGFMANSDSVRNYAIALAKAGIATFAFDYNGGSVETKSDGISTDMSVLTEVKDLKEIIKFVKSQDFVDENEVSLMGFSQGGFVSALTGSELKDEIKSLILYFPALCIPDHARRGSMMFAQFDPNNIPEIIECGPMTLGRCYPKDVIDMDPYKEISAYTGKVLLAHGTADDVVDISYARRAKDVYQNISYYEIEGAGHAFIDDNEIFTINLAKDFILS